jgi:lysophospholipase L1-like esterase
VISRHPNLFRAALSALLTIAFFVLVETALGFAGGQWSALYSGDPGYDWRVRPGLSLSAVPHLEEERTFAVQTNQRGMRDGAVPTKGPWILALGCSTTFGWGVEHDRVWTEVLEQSLGVPVVNAGVPGHSSTQGVRLAEELLALKPDVVIVGWGLRDGQLTVLPDDARRPAEFPRNTRLYRLLAGEMAREESGDVPRVSEAQFQENLMKTAALADELGARVLLLDMTARSETPSHGAQLKTLGLPLVVPQLTNEHHFRDDPIHMNDLGNRLLADQLVAPIQALLNPEEAALPPESAPQQTP